MNDSSSTPTASQTRESSTASTQNCRQKTDKAWEHCIELAMENGKKAALQCIHCNHVIQGSGINRMKQHLAGIKGNAVSCKKIPPNALFTIKQSLIENERKRGRHSKGLVDLGEYDDIEDLDREQVGEGSKKQKRGGIASFMKAGAGIDTSQPSIKVKLLSKEKLHETDMALALWFYDACIPLNATNSEYYQPAMARIASMGNGYKAHNLHALKVPLLNDAKKHVQLSIDAFRSKWVETGCTIMGDGWVDRRQIPLINFLVYCPSGITFIKSVDASDFVSSADNLCKLFGEIVEMVGANNVVHLVTDNGSNYKKAGTLLQLEYPNIFWSPCSAHCVNLILKDIGALPVVKSLAKNGSKITIFVYNHKWPLAWLRRRPGWTEIISPGATRFGTTFIALNSLYEHRQHLEAMVVSNEFRQFLKNPKAKDVKSIVLDSNFWNDCLVIVKIVGPIMRLLRICDTNEKPSMGYIHEGMSRVIRGIKETFRKKEVLYKPFVDIVNDRWDRMLSQRLHAASCWLNPAFRYDSDCDIHFGGEPLRGLMEVAQKWIPDTQNLANEIAMFRDKQNSFGWPLARKNAKNSRPEEWWKIFGLDAPNLQKLAVRILSQISSSSGCERNWSVFERIHTKKRNRLEHQRLNDLVFIHYNLRLQQCGKAKKRFYDPIDYECIDKVEFWVVEEEPDGELDEAELDEIIDESLGAIECSQPSEGVEGENNEIVDEEIDLDRLDSRGFELQRDGNGNVIGGSHD